MLLSPLACDSVVLDPVLEEHAHHLALGGRVRLLVLTRHRLLGVGDVHHTNDDLKQQRDRLRRLPLEVRAADAATVEVNVDVVDLRLEMDLWRSEWVGTWKANLELKGAAAVRRVSWPIDEDLPLAHVAVNRLHTAYAQRQALLEALQLLRDAVVVLLQVPVPLLKVLVFNFCITGGSAASAENLAQHVLILGTIPLGCPLQGSVALSKNAYGR
mmetsp:Transcript_69362/g.215215  ORF Transcript_69362/g.215215 Transcript_69362/m.215215 type:complete len:214 (-) Transcript_69362:14-655(-)